MKIIRIMLFTLFLSFVIILPVVSQIYDNIASVRNIESAGQYKFSASEALHHPAIWVCVSFGLICGLVYIIVSILHLLYFKKFSNKQDYENINALKPSTKDSIFFKVSNIVVLSIIIPAVIIFLMFIWVFIL